MKNKNRKRIAMLAYTEYSRDPELEDMLNSWLMRVIMLIV